MIASRALSFRSLNEASEPKFRLTRVFCTSLASTSFKDLTVERMAIMAKWCSRPGGALFALMEDDGGGVVVCLLVVVLFDLMDVVFGGGRNLPTKFACM